MHVSYIANKIKCRNSDLRLPLPLMPNQRSSSVIDGAWRMESYIRDGKSISPAGILLMTEGRWSTLYFISEGSRTNERWGSAEAGRFELNQDQLIFHHEFTFQGGGGKELLMDLSSSTVETCRIEFTSESLRIFFPSGSAIHCRRLS